MIPTSGWLPPGMTLGAPVLALPLPVPHTGTYRDGGDIVGRQVTQTMAAHTAGGAAATAVAGRNADHERALAVTLSQTSTFGVLLVDAVDFSYVLPPPAFDRSYHVWVRVEVRDALRVFRNLSALAGKDWVEEVEWDEDVDQPVAQATITLWREGRPTQVGDSARPNSLAPLVETSRLNRFDVDAPDDPVDPAATFAPLLEPGREIRVSTATTYAGVAPAEADWRGGFWGVIDEVDWGPGNRVKLSARDLGARLLDAFVEEQQTYAQVPDGAEAGTDPAMVMQQLLDDVLRQRNEQGGYLPGAVMVHHEMGTDPVTGAAVELRPEWRVNPYLQDRKPLLEALRDIALQFGWDVRYRWDAARTEARLTLYAPERDDPNGEKRAPNWTLGPSDYLDVTRLSVSHADVRNVVRVIYTGNDEQHTVTEQNVDSIVRYGRRFMEIQEASSSLIDTQAEATALAKYALNDLAEPEASQEVEMLFFWPVRVTDIFRFEPNGVHYDHPQELAVVRVRHSLGREKHRTSVAVRGRPAGAYRDWLRRERRGSVVPPPKPVIQVTLEESRVDATDYKVHASSPDGSAVTLWYAFGDAPFPSPSNLANGGTVTAPRSTEAAERMLRIRARSARGGEEEQIISADFDVLPEIVFVNPPEPMYQGVEQVGWRITGAVDDDTRMLTLAMDGDPADMAVTAVSVAFLDGGTERIDTRTTKTFRVEVRQEPGAAGFLSLTPHDRVPDEVGVGAGVAGEPYEVLLARPPETVATPRQNSATLRDVVFNVTPASATLRYRVRPVGPLVQPEPAWTVKPLLVGGTVTSDVIDVTAGPMLVEYYASTGTVVDVGGGTQSRGATEAVRQLRLDADDAPQFVTVRLDRGLAERSLALTVAVDDDLVTWRAWARKGAWPLDRTGDPDDLYLRFSGTRNTLSTTWFADVGEWNVIVRGYDYRGQLTEERLSYAMTETPPVTGILQNVRAALQREAGDLYYNDVLWEHNDVVENAADGTFRVRITENDVEVVRDRDARFDHDGDHVAAGGSLVGGWHRPVLAGTPGQPGANRLTFRYRVELYQGEYAQETVIQTHYAAISEWYLGTGDVVEAPTQTPTLLRALTGRQQATGHWVNPSTEWEVVVEWQERGRYGVDWDEARQARLPAGADTHTMWFPGETYVRFRVAYRNVAGEGPFSDWSAERYVLPGTFGYRIRDEEIQEPL